MTSGPASYYLRPLREEPIERDPTAGLQRLRPERPRERILADGEIKTLWLTLDDFAGGETDPVGTVANEGSAVHTVSL